MLVALSPIIRGRPLSRTENAGCYLASTFLVSASVLYSSCQAYAAQFELCSLFRGSDGVGLAGGHSNVPLDLKASSLTE